MTISSIQDVIYYFIATRLQGKQVYSGFYSDALTYISSDNEEQVRGLLRTVYRNYENKEIEDFAIFLYDKYFDESTENIEQGIRSFLEAVDVDMSATGTKTAEDLDNEAVFEYVQKKYYYNQDTQQYIFYLKSAPKPFAIHEDDLKALKRRYSNWDGAESTINQVCRDFKIPRPWFTELKREMGWTHDSEPFLDIEILESENDDQLVEEALQQRRAGLYQKFEARKWNEIRKEAENWRNLDVSFITPLTREIQENLPKYKQYTIPGLRDLGSNETCLVYPAFDLHIGKLENTNEVFPLNPLDYKNKIMGNVEEIINKTVAHGVPEEIVLVLGSDMFHIDNALHSTTLGTPQGGQMWGDFYHIVLAGYEVGFSIVDAFASLNTKIKLVVIPGNHDRMVSLNFALACKERYTNAPNIEINITKYVRQYSSYGTNLFGFVHGENLPSNGNKRKMSFTKFMLSDAKKYHNININSIEYYYYFSGHYHQNNIQFVDGVTDITTPSPSPTDMWHHEKGFESYNERLTMGYMFDKRGGFDNIVFSYIR